MLLTLLLAHVCPHPQVRALADHNGLSVHMDGARVMNAAVALGVPPSTIMQHTHTVSVCLSKVGLRGPILPGIGVVCSFQALTGFFLRVWAPRWGLFLPDLKTSYPEQCVAVKPWVGECDRLVFLQQLESSLCRRW